MSFSERFERQMDILPMERVHASAVSVIGVGAVGRQLAIQLAALGVGRIQLIDFDVVEVRNLGSQAYRPSEVGLPKVEAAGNTIREFDTEIEVEQIADRFRGKIDVHRCVFCAVDSISARAGIWQRIKHRCDFFGDARMLSGTLRVLAAVDDESRARYAESLFPQDHAQRGACTARGTLFGASIAAGILVHEFACWLRDQPVSTDTLIDLPSREWNVLPVIGPPLSLQGTT